MPLCRIDSSAFVGLDATAIEIEVDVVPNGEKLTVVIVGLPDAAVKESKDRVLTAIKNSGITLAYSTCTVNLAPGDIRKEGPLYDLPIALGLVGALSSVPSFKQPFPYLVLGELALSGETRPIHGALAAAILARSMGKKGVLLPAANAKEAAAVPGVEVIPIQTLKDALQFLKNPAHILPQPYELASSDFSLSAYPVDFHDVKGQTQAKRALEIAAAGGHNVLMSGPPGTGKTLLAKAFSSILPALTIDEALNVSKIHSIAGLLPQGDNLLTKRPFRSPHHSVSSVGLIGGGSVPRPGEVSLAHHGVLFLDELPEFSRSALEVLRQPLEDGYVTISRAQGNVTFPTRFICIAAMNPCPCGYLGHPEKTCRDTALQIQRYRSKISGPLLDRLDLHIEVPALRYRDLVEAPTGESSESIRERVQKARTMQHQRFEKIKTNAEMSPRELKIYGQLDKSGQEMMKQAMENLTISARGFDRLLKVARTIADLEGSSTIGSQHLLEAIQFRSV